MWCCCHQHCPATPKQPSMNPTPNTLQHTHVGPAAPGPPQSSKLPKSLRAALLGACAATAATGPLGGLTLRLEKEAYLMPTGPPPAAGGAAAAAVVVGGGGEAALGGAAAPGGGVDPPAAATTGSSDGCQTLRLLSSVVHNNPQPSPLRCGHSPVSVCSAWCLAYMGASPPPCCTPATTPLPLTSQAAGAIDATRPRRHHGRPHRAVAARRLPAAARRCCCGRCCLRQ